MNFSATMLNANENERPIPVYVLISITAGGKKFNPPNLNIILKTWNSVLSTMFNSSWCASRPNYYPQIFGLSRGIVFLPLKPKQPDS